MGEKLNVDGNQFRNQSNSIRFVAPRNMKYVKVLNEVERTLLWYLSPKSEDEQNEEDLKWSALTAKQRASAMEQQWRDRFDLSLFTAPGDSWWMTVAEGYDDLMNDLLMTVLHIRNLMDIDHTEYDAVMQRYDSNLDRGQRRSEWSCFGVFRCFMEYGLDYVFGPLHALCAINDATIYP